jgi:ABC-2 type transport system permease protein
MAEAPEEHLNPYLIRPISYIGYSLSRDAADKTLHLLSSILEVTAAVWILRMPLYRPQSAETFILFAASVLGAMTLYFLMSYAVSAFAFWTAESAGPRFCFELFLEFASGAFFPLDVLPQTLRHVFETLPFATVLYFPLNIFLERASPADIVRGFTIQIFWIAVLFLATKWTWSRGLKVYAAEGG